MFKDDIFLFGILALRSRGMNLDPLSFCDMGKGTATLPRTLLKDDLATDLARK